MSDESIKSEGTPLAELFARLPPPPVTTLPTPIETPSDSIDKTSERSEPVEVLTELSEKTKLFNKANAILEEHGWLESNVPMNSDYWSIKNQIRGLRP